MITFEQYVGPWAKSPDWTTERQAHAVKLLQIVSDLQKEMEDANVVFYMNPKTCSQVSGEVFGGFRPQVCPVGAVHSTHKEGLAVDIYDPHDQIDTWCMAHQDRLAEHGIYIEHPDSTPHWCHMTIKAPGSGHTVFYP